MHQKHRHSLSLRISYLRLHWAYASVIRNLYLHWAMSIHLRNLCGLLSICINSLWICSIRVKISKLKSTLQSMLCILTRNSCVHWAMSIHIRNWCVRWAYHKELLHMLSVCIKSSCVQWAYYASVSDECTEYTHQYNTSIKMITVHQGTAQNNQQLSVLRRIGVVGNKRAGNKLAGIRKAEGK